MPDIYEALVSLAKIDREFANEIDLGGHYWGQHLKSSADQEPARSFRRISMSNMEEAFLDWINGNAGPYSFLIEHFYTDCETESTEVRRDLLYKWMLASFEQGWKAAGGSLK